MTAPVLREGGVLLHIGPHKTGTTAIQGALAAARPQLGEHGISYPGRRLEHNRQAAAAIERSLGWDHHRLDMGIWNRLAAVIRGISGRVVVSSEVFCEASPDAAKKVVTDLGPERVQVVVTLRPLEKLLPSSWQQHIKSGYTIPYDEWLDHVLSAREPSTSRPSFWDRNNHPAVIGRWCEAVGVEEVMVVVVDSNNPRSLFDAFEDILQLERGALNADDYGPSNRSLSGPEVELLRAFNRRARGAISHGDYDRIVKRTAVRRLIEGRTPDPDEPRLTTPAWAVEKAREYSRADVAAIAAMGVAVVGDLDLLAPSDAIPDTPLAAEIDAVPKSLAAAFMFHLVEAGIDVSQRSEEPRRPADRPSLAKRVRREIRAALPSTS